MLPPEDEPTLVVRIALLIVAFAIMATLAFVGWKFIAWLWGF